MGDLRPEEEDGAAVSLPVIDLSLGRDEVGRAVLHAGKDVGFFQVINHGVPEEAIRAMEALCEEYFAMPEEDRMGFYSEDNGKANRFFSGSTYDTGGARLFLFDCLRLSSSFPIADESKNNWPHQPHTLRDVVERFTVPTRAMGMELLRLLCEAMGLPLDYFEEGLGSGNMTMTLNRYPACPNPGTMMGLPPHCDRNLLSLLLPSAIPGLQFSHKGKWTDVVTLPNAYIVNFGLPLEVVTNGVLKSIEHRVVTNPTRTRMSVGVFITPTPDCLIGPAEEFLSEEKPARYHAVTFDEFYRLHSVVKHGLSSVLTINRRENVGDKETP